MRPGDLYRREQIALEDSVSREILTLIGMDLLRMKQLEAKMNLKQQDLEHHLALLEQAMLLEREEEGYRLTPRCIAYLEECLGYEWRR